MTTEDSDITSLKVYERESAIRFEYIEKRLEALIWGIYPVLITCLVATRYI